MSLKEILERKMQAQTQIKEIKEEKEELHIKPQIIYDRKEAEEYLFVFLVCFYKFYSRDLRIGHGMDFLHFYSFLVGDYTFKEEDYPPLPFGQSVQSEYLLSMIYKLPANVVYHILPKNFS